MNAVELTLEFIIFIFVTNILWLINKSVLTINLLPLSARLLLFQTNLIEYYLGFLIDLKKKMCWLGVAAFGQETWTGTNERREF